MNRSRVVDDIEDAHGIAPGVRHNCAGHLRRNTFVRVTSAIILIDLIILRVINNYCCRIREQVQT